MTILDQLRSLDSSRLASILKKHAATILSEAKRSQPSSGCLPSEQLSQKNVIVNYLVHHLLALHYADGVGKRRGDASEAFECALIYEAIAQGYLLDAFSSGHILTPVSDPFSLLSLQKSQGGARFLQQ